VTVGTGFSLFGKEIYVCSTTTIGELSMDYGRLNQTVKKILLLTLGKGCIGFKSKFFLHQKRGLAYQRSI
jgi:hypothetical protein